MFCGPAAKQIDAADVQPADEVKFNYQLSQIDCQQMLQSVTENFMSMIVFSVNSGHFSSLKTSFRSPEGFSFDISGKKSYQIQINR